VLVFRHSQKETAYNFFRAHDARTIKTLKDQVEQLQKSSDALDPKKLERAQQQLHKLLHEGPAAKAERYAEQHQEMIEMHTLGIEELDFHRTGL